MRKGIDITNRRFGKLIAIKKIGRDEFGHALWECLCDCGKSKNIVSDSLLRGLTLSCGCLRTEKLKQRATHGHTAGGLFSSEYRSWASMKARCINKKNKKFQDYGARGIFVCDRWMDFNKFLQDMGRKPSKDHTIERIDNDGNYEPTNCKWGTDAEQSRNRRSNRWFQHDGKKMILKDWATFLNTSDTAMRQMLKTKTFPEVYHFYLKKLGRHF